MCTVTYIPQHKGFILTSNRDEKSFRKTIAPQKYVQGETTICYPKDVEAGGSWIAMNDMGRAVCLLNGGFIAHQKKGHHTNSRGNALLKVAGNTNNPDTQFTNEELAKTQPFTLLTIDFDSEQVISFSELIWDGYDKHFRQLDVKGFYIWSSVTLYSDENRKERKQWFSRFLKECKMKPNADEIIQFHSGTHTNNNAVNVVMERHGGLKTVSITQISNKGDLLEMKYADLLGNEQHLIEL